MTGATAAYLAHHDERQTRNAVGQLSYTVGVMAYNEEANIRHTLRAIQEQIRQQTELAEIIVVASGCTDHTVSVVQEMMQEDERIQLLIQEQREGKASAINLFLKRARSPILVLVGADVIPERDALERLCEQFRDPTVGMVGAHPVPVNDQDSLTGYAVHLLWQLHDRLARRSPKLGEVIAFRNTIDAIPPDTAVDELSIQAIIARQGLTMRYVPQAIVYNKGPVTIEDFLSQRRRIYAGHVAVRASDHYESPTMSVRAILRALREIAPQSVTTPRQGLYLLGTIALEGTARFQGRNDTRGRRSHHIWRAVASTKKVQDERRKLRRIHAAQSVIVFKITRKRTGDELPPLGDRSTLRMLRSLLPELRKQVRKDDHLSIHSGDMLVALLNAERTEAEKIALRLKQEIEARSKLLNKEATDPPAVQYHAVMFGEQTSALI